MLLFISILFSTLLSSCITTNNNSINDLQEKTPLSYLALGDSYTIGEGVSSSKRWSVVLAKKLTQKGYPVAPPTIIAKTGWRTDNLLRAMTNELDKTPQYDLVSILIGVNNQFQGKSIVTYEKELHLIFERAIAACKSGKSGVFVLSIPDYGATPYGKNNAKKIGQAIDQWNQIFKKVTLAYQLSWYNITPISRTASNDPSLIAKDGLHPSGKMYQLWVQSITTAIEKKLATK